MNLTKFSITASCLSIALTLAGAATVAAQSNELVKARQDVMKSVGANTKILGEMASGEKPYDAAAAEAAKAGLIAASSDVAAKFETQAEDPLSEAKPEIWTNWDDFLAKSANAKAAVAAADVSSVDGLRAGMGAIAATCKDCHSTYRM